jgi:hypothetical protein
VLRVPPVGDSAEVHWVSLLTQRFMTAPQAAVSGGLSSLLSAWAEAAGTNPLETACRASFITRQTLAFEIPYAFARSFRLIPRSRSMSSAARFTSRGVRPNELAPTSIGEELIETRASRFRTTDLVGVLVDDLEATLRGEAAQVVELGFGVLIHRRDTHVQGRTFAHPRRPFFRPAGRPFG